MSEKVGGLWADSSVNQKRMENNGAPEVFLASGKFGLAASFSTDGHLETPGGDSYYNITDGPIEVSGWAYQNDNTQSGAVIECGEGWSVGYTGDAEGGPGYHMILVNVANDFSVAQSAIRPASQTWSYVEGRYEPGVGVTVGINRVETFLPTSDHPQFLNNVSFRLGLGILAYQNGRLSDVGVWRRLLSVEERNWKYNSGLGNRLFV